jgi:hypothetical protein
VHTANISHAIQNDFVVKRNTLSRDRVTIDGVWNDNRIY